MNSESYRCFKLAHTLRIIAHTINSPQYSYLIMTFIVAAVMVLVFFIILPTAFCIKGLRRQAGASEEVTDEVCIEDFNIFCPFFRQVTFCSRENKSS
ncbi:hypothetical protein Y032_1049g3492 [Ancylostoma ceylanicum]|uniref:Uncharacterized protein n=1 Tax=Ancylostoma ceylanicum TaxID=53326 RepID=A0A016W8X2_9BILA|nr:hypothetical protein Y032_1049g3492 [Ancylostoma ceylanicum]